MQMSNPWFRGGGILAAGLLLCSGLAATPAMAALITYNFTGDVTGVHPLVSSGFDTSMKMKGSMTVVNMVDQGPDPRDSSYGLYEVQSFNVTIGDYTATLRPSSAGSIEIVHEWLTEAGTLTDGLFAAMEQMDANIVNLLDPRFFAISLFGPSRPDKLFGSDALPIALPPSVSSFKELNDFRLVFGLVGTPVEVSGDITSLTVVPLPAAVLLFGAGLISLVGLGAGGLRNLRGAKA
jgi:hypothetical protein